MKKKIIIFINLFLLLCVFFNSGLNVNAHSDETFSSSLISESLIDELSETGQFSSDRILIVLDTNLNELDKEYTVDDFPELELKSVTELTKMSKQVLVEQINSIEMSNEMIINENTYKRILALELNDPSKENVLRGINKLNERVDIISAEPDSIVISEEISPPNDFYYSNNTQWNLNGSTGINIESAWEISTGTSDVLVGIIDTGIFSNHPDLINRINIRLSRDFSLDEPYIPTNVTDIRGHGTHVAGIIGAQGNNTIGICGVNQNVQLVSLRISPQNVGDSFASQLILAIDYAIEADIPILNNSNGIDEFPGSISSVNAFETQVNNYPGLFVTSAGNSSIDNDTNPDRFPSNTRLPNLITVGSHNINNRVSNFSNWGENTVDIFAPGGERNFDSDDNPIIDDDIVSTYPTTLSCNIANGYTALGGTSMATPHVTGVAALILSKYPHLSGAALKEIIMNGVEIVLDQNNNSVFADFCVSGGKLDAYQSLNSYKTLTKNVETEVINNLNDGKGLFGFSYYGSGFVDITMNAVIQNAIPSYPNGSFRLLNSKGEVVKKYEMTNYSDEAINKNGYNTLSVFLPESGYYYIDVDYDVENLSSLKLLVENNDVYSPSVNLFNFNDYQEFSINFIDNVSSVDYFKQITLKQAASFEFDITLSGSARFVVLKRTSSSASSGLTVIENEVITGNNTIELDLSHGTYYIGYFDLLQGGTFGLTMNRFVTESGSSLLITDPDQYTNCGSQITVAEMNTHASNRSYRQNTIIEGFTRIIYLGNGNTRQAYYWYSSNEDVATVSEFGTVFAQNVTQDTTVKIMAVYKTDPSIVYIKEFRILNDTETYESSPLNIDGITLNVHAGQFTYITFGDKDVPINWLQYYYWESSDTDYVTVDGFGRIYAYSSAIGETFTITGIYNYNTRVKITITVNIIE